YHIVEFMLFVTFFPRLIAGPIVRPAEIIPQFQELKGCIRHEDISVGITLLVVGLIEKVLLADGLAVLAGDIFTRASFGYQPTCFEAWQGALAYTGQLYFDFAGYSNMAIGLARIFGVRLPVNFASPYRATSIVEFWRRWH